MPLSDEQRQELLDEVMDFTPPATRALGEFADIPGVNVPGAPSPRRKTMQELSEAVAPSGLEEKLYEKYIQPAGQFIKELAKAQAKATAGALTLKSTREAAKTKIPIGEEGKRTLEDLVTGKKKEAKFNVPFVGEVDVSKEGIPEKVLADLIKTPLGAMTDLIDLWPAAFLKRPGRALLEKAAGKKIPSSLIPEVPPPVEASPTIATPLPAPSEMLKETAKRLRIKAEDIKHSAKIHGVPKKAQQHLEEALFQMEKEKDPALALLKKGVSLEKAAKTLGSGKAPELVEEAMFKLLREPTPHELELFFARSLSPEGGLTQGLKAAAKGRAAVTTPLDSAVTSPSAQTQSGLGALFGAAKNAVSRFWLPDSIMAQEAASARTWNWVRAQEKVWHKWESTYIPFLERITKGVDTASRTEIKAALSGRLDPLRLSEANRKIYAQYRRVYDRVGIELGLGPGKWIDDYFPIVLDKRTGLPKDIVEIRAGAMALDDVAAGKIPFPIEMPSTPVESVRAKVVLDAIKSQSPALAGEYELKAIHTLRNMPSETFFAHTFFRRLSKEIDPQGDLLDVTIHYLKGAARKIHLDRMMNDPIRGVKAALGDPNTSPFMKEYLMSFMDAYRGVDRGITRTFTLGVDKLVDTLERGGHSVASKMAKAMYPRAFSPVIRSWQFAAKIGGNLATPLVNLSQTAINTVTELGLWNTTRAIAQYLNPARIGQTRALLERAGIKYVPTQTELFQRVRGLSRVNDVLGFLFKQSEEFNRGVAFLGAHRMALTQGKSAAQAIKIGQDIVDQTQFIFGKSNIPLIIQNPFGALIGQFKTYAINQLRWYASLMKGVGPRAFERNAVGRTNAQRFATGMLSTVSVGGIGSMLPFYTGLKWIQDIKEEQLPEVVEDYLIGGLARAGLNLDLSEAVGPAGILPPSPLTATRTTDVERLSRELLGPTFSSVPELVKNMNQYLTFKDKDSAARLFKLFIRNMPAGVQTERSFFPEIVEGLGLDLPTGPHLAGTVGRRSRLSFPETPQGQRLRKVFGARTKEVAQGVEDLLYFTEEQRTLQNRTAVAEDEILSNVGYYMENPDALDAFLEEQYTKYGVSVQELDKKLMERGLPAIVRQYLTASRPLKLQMELERPGLTDRIKKQLYLFQIKQQAAKERTEAPWEFEGE